MPAIPPEYLVEVIIFTMCALTGVDPFYNCDEMWTVYYYTNVYDVFDYCYPERKGTFHIAVVGCAWFDDERAHKLMLGSHINGMTNDGHTTFIHELTHMKCRCMHHD